MFNKKQLRLLSLLYKHKKIAEPILLKKMNMDKSSLFVFLTEDNLRDLYNCEIINGTLFYFLTEIGEAVVYNHKSDILYNKKGPLILSVLALVVSIISLIISFLT